MFPAGNPYASNGNPYATQQPQGAPPMQTMQPATGRFPFDAVIKFDYQPATPGFPTLKAGQTVRVFEQKGDLFVSSAGVFPIFYV